MKEEKKSQMDIAFLNIKDFSSYTAMFEDNPYLKEGLKRAAASFNIMWKMGHDDTLQFLMKLLADANMIHELIVLSYRIAQYHQGAISLDHMYRIGQSFLLIHALTHNIEICSSGHIQGGA